MDEFGKDTAQLDEVSFSFKSEYAEEDISPALGEIFPPYVAQLDSRVRLGRLSAVYLDKVRNCLGLGQTCLETSRGLHSRVSTPS